MYTFNYVGGRGASEEFRASLLLSTGQDLVLWEAQNRGLIIAGQTGDSYYSTEKILVTSVAFDGLRQYFGCYLQTESNVIITLSSPSKTSYLKWGGRLLRTEALLNKVALNSPLYRAIKYQPIVSKDITAQIISFSKATNRQVQGRRISMKRMEGVV